ncbi:MAG: hypothetical protein R2704_09670 [Microthrixaceae bacterium]
MSMPDHQQDLVGDLHKTQHDVVEVGRSVDDDRTERAQHLGDLHHLGRTDLIGGERPARAARGCAQPGRSCVIGLLEEVRVDAISAATASTIVCLGVSRHHGDIAELEVGVPQTNRPGGPLCQRHASEVASIDLPAPPLVEKTVTTLPGLRRRPDRRRSHRPIPGSRRPVRRRR